MVKTQLLSQSPPSVWSEYQNRTPETSNLVIQAPTVAVVPEGQAENSSGVLPPVIRGLDETQQPANLQVQGEAGATFTTGTQNRVITFSPSEVREVDTDITEINVPNFANPQETIKKNQLNPLGLSTINAPAGNIFQTSFATVSATQGAVIRTTRSQSDGTNVQGFSSHNTGNTIDASGFIQHGNSFGVTGRYNSTPTGSLIEGRSFFNLNTNSTDDKGNSIAGFNSTVLVNFRQENRAEGSTTLLNGSVGASIPVGETDSIRTVDTLDTQEGLTNLAATYNTQIGENSLTVAGQTGRS